MAGAHGHLFPLRRISGEAAMNLSRMLSRVMTLALPCLLLPAAAAAQSASGPSAEQIAQVDQRRASFPGPALVQSVDWYQPLGVVAGRPGPLPAGKPLAAAQARRLDAFAAQTGSFALIVARNGKLVYEHYAPGFDARSRYDTASMHKPVVALLLGAAVADGFVRGPDDRLDAYLPELSGDPRGAITLRQLLEMDSGLRTPPLSDSSASPYWQTYFGTDLRWSIAQWPFERSTQGQFYYANANTQYLTWVIERATGRSYVDYLSSRLWSRVGAGEARVWLDHAGGNVRGFCCLQASARDWLRIGELVRNAGRSGGARLVPGDWIARMLAPSPANANFGWNVWRGAPHNPRRTYGPGIPAVVEARAPFARDDTYYFDGSGGQRVYIIPSERLVIVRIGTPRADWDDSALPNLLVSPRL